MDYAAVRRAKKHVLAEEGAQTKPDQTGMRYPLQAESWTMVDTDLRDRGWAATLCIQGLKPSMPTLWIAEGILNHLPPNDLHEVLSSCAAVRTTI